MSAPSAASGFAKLISTLEAAGGLVTYASLLMMVFLGAHRVERKFKSLVRIMVYLDATAFALYYTSLVVDPTSSTCPATYLQFVADLVWASKDCARIAYLIHRGLVVHDKRMPWVVIGSGAISLLLYWVFMAMVYRLSGACKSAWSAEAAIALYAYWTLCELFSGVMVTMKIRELLTVTAPEPPSAEQAGNSVRGQSQLTRYRSLFRFQETRVLLSNVMMLYMTLMTILTILGVGVPLMKNLIFTFGQLILLLSASAGQSVRDGDKTASTPSTGLQMSSGAATNARTKSRGGIPRDAEAGRIESLKGAA